jgi:hypothetical protein
MRQIVQKQVSHREAVRVVRILPTVAAESVGHLVAAVEAGS